MNTGIGDAVNLAWKLAAVLQGGADESILDTYETERIAFARSLVATTDRIFQLMIGSGTGSKLFREEIFPHVVPFALGFQSARPVAFELVSQTHLNYRHSALSHGKAGEIEGGDRLPWVDFCDGSDNFDSLRSLDWQIHVYGTASLQLQRATQQAHLAVREFGWTDAIEKAGFARDGMYLIRPDGYVALASKDQDVSSLSEYLGKFKIQTREA